VQKKKDSMDSDPCKALKVFKIRSESSLYLFSSGKDSKPFLTAFVYRSKIEIYPCFHEHSQ